MKKFLLTTISILTLLALLSSCDFGKETVDITTPTSTTSVPTSTTTTTPLTTTTTTTTTTTVTTSTTTTSSIKPTESQKSSDLPKYVPGSIKLRDIENVQADLMLSFVPTRRSVYYTISGFFIDLIEINTFNEWANKNLFKEIGKEPQEMSIVSFVKHFNISKEVFEETIEEMREPYNALAKELSDEETYELPNADIIYTFDNDIINEYYRRE